MGSFSSEQKLLLRQQIRARHQQERSILKSREGFLHSAASGTDLPELSFQQDPDLPPSHAPFTFLRIVISLVLAVLIIASVHREAPIFGLAPDEFFTILDQDYYEMAETYFSGSSQ